MLGDWVLFRSLNCQLFSFLKRWSPWINIHGGIAVVEINRWGASLASYDIWYNFINLCTSEIITRYVKKFRIEFCSVERSSWIFELSKHFLERIVYLVDTFYNLAKLQHCYSDTSQHRKIFARSEYKSIAQTALYECSRFVVGGGGDHRTCAPRGSPPENKWDSIEDLIIRLRWKGRLGQNDAEAVGGGDLLIVQWNIFV